MSKPYEVGTFGEPEGGDEMVRIVRCGCGAQEYFGMMHWRDGHQFCRRCIESIWRKDGWDPDYKQEAFKFYFPQYSDGIDYTPAEKGEKIYVDINKLIHEGDKK